MKDTFILYASYAESIDDLSMEQRGQLLTAILAYANEREIPEIDGIVAMAWKFIKRDLDHNADKYEQICEKRRQAGIASGEARRRKSNKRTNVDFVEHNDNENDSDNENVYIKKRTKRTSVHFKDERDYDFRELEKKLIGGNNGTNIRPAKN